jgi:hypothetical protein
MAVPISVWDSRAPGDPWSIYGDGQIKDSSGSPIPGNWGTLDIGNQSNSSSDLSDQIRNGLRQEDLDALYDDGSIPDDTHIDSQHQMWLNGDTGLSAGLKHAIEEEHGTKKLLPLFDQSTGQGGNLNFHIVGWGVVEIVGSHWNGSKQTRVIVQKSYTYDGDLRPQTDLSNTTDIIQAAYTSPVLVQ